MPYSRWDLNCCCGSGTCENFYKVFNDIMPYTTSLEESVVNCQIEKVYKKGPGASLIPDDWFERFWWHGSLKFRVTFSERSIAVDPFPKIPSDCRSSMQYNITNGYSVHFDGKNYFPMHPRWKSVFGTEFFDMSQDSKLYESDYDWDSDPESFYGSPCILLNNMGLYGFERAYYVPEQHKYSIPSQGVLNAPLPLGYIEKISPTRINIEEKTLTFPEVSLYISLCVDMLQILSYREFPGQWTEGRPPSCWANLQSGGPVLNGPIYGEYIPDGYETTGTEPLFNNGIYESCKFQGHYYLKGYPFLGDAFCNQFYETIETVKTLAFDRICSVYNACTFRIEDKN